MKKFLFLTGFFLIGFLLITGGAGQASALTIQNASFESDLTGWNSSGSASTSSSINDSYGNLYQPRNLESFAELAGKDAEIFQESNWLAGETISFDWSYLSFDGLGTNDDYAFFEIGDSSGSIEIITISADGADSIGWLSYTYTFTSDSGSDSYILFGVVSDLEYDSDWNDAPILLVDNITTTTVPEPASLLLFASGLLSIAGMRRKL